MDNRSYTYNSTVSAVYRRNTIVVAVDSCLLTFVNILSLLGNLFVLRAIYRNKRLHTITNIFVINLALSDVLMSVLVMPFSSGSSIKDEWIFGSLGCQVFVIVGYILSGVSLETLILIACNRYVRVVRAVSYPFVYTKTHVVMMCVCSWLTTAGLVGVGFPLIGIGFKQVEGNPAICVAHCDTALSITYVALVLALYLIPCGTLIPFSYFKVFRKIINHNATIASNLKNGNSAHGIEEAKITKLFVTVLLGFCACWLPAFLSTSLYVCGALDQSDSLVYSNLYWTTPVYTSCFINPIIYTAMSKPFRKELLIILTCTTDYKA